MTYLKKLTKDCPGLSYLAIEAIVRSMCPRDFGYEDPESCKLRCPIKDASCEECWNRKIPEEMEDVSR